jgi:hypothetical protein
MSIAEHLGRAIEKHKSKHGKKEEKKSHPMHEHKVKRMEIEPEDEGDGYIITHYPAPESGKLGGGGATFRDSYSSYKEPTKHVAKDHKALMKHVKEHCCPDASDVEESAVSK